MFRVGKGDLPSYLDRSRVGRLNASNAPEQGGLSGARGTKERNESALLYLEAHILHRGDLTESLSYLIHLQLQHKTPTCAPRTSRRLIIPIFRKRVYESGMREEGRMSSIR